MYHEALVELKAIINEPNYQVRQALVENWEKKWIYHTKQTQSVINKSILNSEEIDFVWYKVSQMCAEDLMDNGITHNYTDNHSFNCETWALRSPYAKFKTSTKHPKKAG